jgi:hypothetical protein
VPHRDVCAVGCKDCIRDGHQGYHCTTPPNGWRCWASIVRVHRSFIVAAIPRQPTMLLLVNRCYRRLTGRVTGIF